MKTEQKLSQDSCVPAAEDVVVCPMCLAMTSFQPEEKTCCEVCGREITEEDLNYQSLNER